MRTKATLTRIIIFAKTPTPGFVKTRLIPALGADGCAKLATIMLDHTVAQALAAQDQHQHIIIELCIAPNPADAFWQWTKTHPSLTLSSQAQGDLGQRLHQRAARIIAQGEHVILIGTDCPGITTQRLLEAVAQLDQHDAVLHPTHDGGYALLGLRRAPSQLFTNIPWSTEEVAGITLTRLQEQNMSTATMATLQDIDRPADLSAIPAAWQVRLPTIAKATSLN